MHLVSHTKQLFDEIQTLLEKKNQDYSGGNPDGFENFRESARFAAISVKEGIMSRLYDKVARLSRLHFKETTEGTGPAVQNESFEDTCIDLIGYTAILIAWRRSVIDPDIDELNLDE